jgi:NAD(P)-dependent dehydrogenase (short-subunit alcohol dehydrogenase family)
MSKVVLIAGSETLLGRKIVEKELNLGNRVVAPVSSSGESSTGESSRENLLVIPWNKSSLFSAKTIIQETVRRWGYLDRAYIIGGVNQERAPFADLSLADLDKVVDREIKGLLYLTNQLMNLLSKKPSSSLFFIRRVFNGSGNGIDRGCSGFFKELSDGIMEERQENITVAGFISSTTNAEAAAESILEYAADLPDKARGEWLRISEKRNRFSPLPIEKRN